MGNSRSKAFDLHSAEVTTNTSPRILRCSRSNSLDMTKKNASDWSAQTTNSSSQGRTNINEYSQQSGKTSERQPNGEQNDKTQRAFETSHAAKYTSHSSDGSMRNVLDDGNQNDPEHMKQPTGQEEMSSCQCERMETINILNSLHDISPLKREILTSYSDRQLCTITKFYRQRLEEAIEEFVEIVSAGLQRENMFTDMEHQSIRELTQKGNRAEASRQLFTIVMEHGAETGRTLWTIFVKFGDVKLKLKNILNEIYEKGTNLPRETTLQTMESKLSSYLKDIQEIHREYLRSQNEKLLVSNIQRNVLKTFSLSDRYTELIVIANVRERRLLEHELWARGRDHEDWQKKLVREELEKIRIHQLLRGCFGKSSLGGTTVVSGVAGIGKTTMVQKIIHDWAIGQMYAQFSFVFHFKFRDLNDISGRTSLKALLLSSYSHFEGLIQHLWEHPENLLFIFDGLDEFKFNIDFSDWKKRSKGEQDCIDPESHCDLVDIVRCLVQGKLLMNCSVLVTSRPHALDSLERADINLWAEILGFFAEERREYFRKFYGNVTLAEDVFQKIQQNDILYTMCYNPAYCWILCSSLVPSFSNLEFENHLPTTITQLFTNHIYNILNNHTREVNNARDVLLKTGKMAFEGVSRNEIVFNQNHFHQYKLKPSKFISGFMMEILEKDYSTTSAVYTFIHLTIQEYLAALSPYLERAPQNVHKLLEEAEHQGDGRFDIFLRFLVGLSTPSTTQQLAHFLGDFQQEVPCQVKVWLTRTVKTQFTNTRTKKDRRKLMNIFHYVFESQDKLMRFTGECRLKINLGCIEESEALRLTPVDCFVLATVLDLCDFIEELDLNYCYIQAEGLQRLSRILHKCKVLRLLSNNLTDAGMKELAGCIRRPDCKIQILELNINGLTDDCAEVLATAFSTNLSIIELDLQRNRFRSAAPFSQLIKCCTTLQKISLTWNQFSGAAKSQLRSLHESRTGLVVSV